MTISNTCKRKAWPQTKVGRRCSNTMKATLMAIVLLITATSACGQTPDTGKAKANRKEKKNKQDMENTVAMPETIHGFVVKDINGAEFDLAQLKGKKVMIVNTASKCGLTPQYEKLEELYKKYGSDKFVIIGFPANNFMMQEPGSDAEIAEFCTKNYGVTFPMMSKISVKGNDMHILYQWLTQKKYNGVADNDISWNFEKILIDENGRYVKAMEPSKQPDDTEIINWITAGQ
jgi:glutathione peroxidase